MHTQPKRIDDRNRVVAPVSREVSGERHVLVVDDDDGVRGVSCRMLQRLGYGVSTASNGLEALVCYQANPGMISLVLLDLAMPVMDGYDCCRELCRLDPHVRVVVVTGHAPRERDPAWGGAAVRSVLYKPFTAEALEQAVRQALAC